MKISSPLAGADSGHAIKGNTSAAKVMSGHSNVILVVDDEPDVLTAICDILEQNGYTVLRAGSCSSALQQCLLSVELGILDVALPEMDGCQLATLMREIQPNLGVLFMSGYTGGQVCQAYGIDIEGPYFLPKPFSSIQLTLRVRQLLNSTERCQIRPRVKQAG
jgi:DNA-binding response OmpR family regulator